MNDLRYINYEARRMLLDSIGMTVLCELAHRRLCDYVWAVGELPPDQNDLLRQHTRMSELEWGRVRRELLGKGWFTRDTWLCHRGVLDSYNAAQGQYVASYNQTAKARGVPPLVCVTHPETGIVSFAVTTPVTAPVTHAGTGGQPDKSIEVEVKTDSHGQSTQYPSSGGSQPRPGLTKLTMAAAACDRLAGEILSNDRQWYWDNCKVRPGDFLRKSLATELGKFAGRIAETGVHEAWREAVVRTHKAVVDGLVKKTPAGYCIICWRECMATAAKNGGRQ